MHPTNFDYEFILTSTDKINIGPDITITAIKLNSTEAHIGCAAPKHIEILRQELINVEQHIVEKIRYK